MVDVGCWFASLTMFALRALLVVGDWYGYVMGLDVVCGGACGNGFRRWKRLLPGG